MPYASRLTYRTDVWWNISVGESLATMAIDRDGGGFRHRPINCLGGATVVASFAYCRSSCAMFAARGRSDEKGCDTREEN